MRARGGAGVAQAAGIWQFSSCGRDHAMPNLSQAGGYVAQ
jgi:hypothetical protein